MFIMFICLWLVQKCTHSVLLCYKHLHLKHNSKTGYIHEALAPENTCSILHFKVAFLISQEIALQHKHIYISSPPPTLKLWTNVQIFIKGVWMCQSHSHFIADKSVSQYVLASSPLCGRLTRYCFLFKCLGLEYIYTLYNTYNIN
jgi:hypothetical protein